MFTEIDMHGVGRSMTLIGQLFCLQFTCSPMRGCLVSYQSVTVAHFLITRGCEQHGQSFSGPRRSVIINDAVDATVSRAQRVLVMHSLQLLFAFCPPFLFPLNQSLFSLLHPLLSLLAICCFYFAVQTTSKVSGGDLVRHSAILICDRFNSVFRSKPIFLNPN